MHSEPIHNSGSEATSVASATASLPPCPLVMHRTHVCSPVSMAVWQELVSAIEEACRKGRAIPDDPGTGSLLGETIEKSADRVRNAVAKAANEEVGGSHHYFEIVSPVPAAEWLKIEQTLERIHGLKADGEEGVPGTLEERVVADAARQGRIFARNAVVTSFNRASRPEKELPAVPRSLSTRLIDGVHRLLAKTKVQPEPGKFSFGYVASPVVKKQAESSIQKEATRDDAWAHDVDWGCKDYRLQQHGEDWLDATKTFVGKVGLWPERISSPEKPIDDPGAEVVVLTNLLARVGALGDEYKNLSWAEFKDADAFGEAFDNAELFDRAIVRAAGSEEFLTLFKVAGEAGQEQGSLARWRRADTLKEVDIRELGALLGTSGAAIQVLRPNPPRVVGGNGGRFIEDFSQGSSEGEPPRELPERQRKNLEPFKPPAPSRVEKAVKALVATSGDVWSTVRSAISRWGPPSESKGRHERQAATYEPSIAESEVAKKVPSLREENVNGLDDTGYDLTHQPELPGNDEQEQIQDEDAKSVIASSVSSFNDIRVENREQLPGGTWAEAVSDFFGKPWNAELEGLLELEVAAQTPEDFVKVGQGLLTLKLRQGSSFEWTDFTDADAMLERLGNEGEVRTVLNVPGDSRYLMLTLVWDEELQTERVWLRSDRENEVPHAEFASLVKELDPEGRGIRFLAAPEAPPILPPKKTGANLLEKHLPQTPDKDEILKATKNLLSSKETNPSSKTKYVTPPWIKAKAVLSSMTAQSVRFKEHLERTFGREKAEDVSWMVAGLASALSAEPPTCLKKVTQSQRHDAFGAALAFFGIDPWPDDMYKSTGVPVTKHGERAMVVEMADALVGAAALPLKWRSLSWQSVKDGDELGRALNASNVDRAILTAEQGDRYVTLVKDETNERWYRADTWQEVNSATLPADLSDSGSGFRVLANASDLRRETPSKVTDLKDKFVAGLRHAGNAVREVVERAQAKEKTTGGPSNEGADKLLEAVKFEFGRGKQYGCERAVLQEGRELMDAADAFFGKGESWGDDVHALLDTSDPASLVLLSNAVCEAGALPAHRYGQLTWESFDSQYALFQGIDAAPGVDRVILRAKASGEYLTLFRRLDSGQWLRADTNRPTDLSRLLDELDPTSAGFDVLANRPDLHCDDEAAVAQGDLSWYAAAKSFTGLVTPFGQSLDDFFNLNSKAEPHDTVTSVAQALVERHLLATDFQDIAWQGLENHSNGARMLDEQSGRHALVQGPDKNLWLALFRDEATPGSPWTRCDTLEPVENTQALLADLDPGKGGVRLLLTH